MILDNRNVVPCFTTDPAATDAELAALVFTTSSPASRPDWATSAGRWRCEHLAELRRLIERHGEFYAEGAGRTKAGRGRMRVGHRTLTAGAHGEARAAALSGLAATLKGLGLKVRMSRRNGLVSELTVIDHYNRATA